MPAHVRIEFTNSIIQFITITCDKLPIISICLSIYQSIYQSIYPSILHKHTYPLFLTSYICNRCPRVRILHRDSEVSHRVRCRQATASRGGVSCCTALSCTVLHCTVLYCTVLYCTVLYCTVLCCTYKFMKCMCLCTFSSFSPTRILSFCTPSDLKLHLNISIACHGPHY